MVEISRRRMLGAAAATGLAATAARAVPPALPDLKGQAVLITGCSSGFGRLTAEHLARAGAKVFATMRNLPRPEAAEVRQLARDAKLDLTVLELDVTDEASVAAAIAAAEKAVGRGLDVLVNNAGIGITGPVEVQDTAATSLAFDTNVLGYHRVARAALPGMRARKTGHIFAVSSQLGRVIAPFAGHYSATKFAVEAMFEQLAYEVRAHGIGVTIIQPGGYPTDIWVNRNRLSGELKARAEARHAAGYPEVVARMGAEDGSGRSADPMDIPRAIAAVLAAPAPARPLRVPVSAGPIPQTGINQASAEAQILMLGRSPTFGPIVRAVHGR
ncbi:SDR family NAD(P)-dependent oxidoreductase [Qipengyuania sediminis]|uniref:SDR family NAD(P)-dependent oxidoreductase n=1 Tax=Qipengyuania sediminis TaxID=1532023 RepID=UPI0010592F4D|nr:SDR family NAD(P)-dependent oxidoreductase [Qipengyuania sediminis]